MYLIGALPATSKNGITVTGCTPAADTNMVDGLYHGLGVVVKDDNGQDQLITIITSYGDSPVVTPVRALFNVFE